MKGVVVLKKGREASLSRFHPWIFSGAISSTKGNIEGGDIVDVFSFEGEFICTGHYSDSTIKVRVLSFDKIEIDQNFWLEKLNSAYKVRINLDLYNSLSNNSFRLVHGEGDFLPGLVIDFFNGDVVIQCHSLGMVRSVKEISEALKELFKERLKSIYFKNALEKESEYNDTFIFNNIKDSCIITENSIKFKVDIEKGQKTGFFLDQRENRYKVREYANNKKVLNLYSYSGGFSLNSLKGGATMVHSVDSSLKAIELLEENLRLNVSEISQEIIEKHKSYTVDAYDFLSNSEDGFYDLIIVDPPAFAKHRDSVINALKAYKRLNTKAISKIAKGGIIFTFSCSQAIDKTMFANTIFTAAAITKRRVRIIGRMTQPVDHPVSIYHPEGEYLKGLIIYVE